MKFLKDLFTRKVFSIVLGTCICVWAVLFTLSLLESALIETNGESRWYAWRTRIDQVVTAVKPEEVVLYRDTVQGKMFPFQKQLVLPLEDIKKDLTGQHKRILNFKLYDASSGTISMLFPDNRDISHSRLLQVKDAILWVIESDTVAYLYDSRSTSLLSFPKHSGFHLDYPMTLKNMALIKEVSDEDDAGESKRVVAPELPDVYGLDTSYPSFSLIGDQLVFYAESRSGRMYWAYDMKSCSITSLSD